MRVPFEGNHRRLVLVGFDYIFDKGAGRSFFVRQGPLFRTADIDEKSDRQRPISLALKSEELLGHAVFQHAHVALLQRSNVAVVLIGRAEEQISEISFSANDIDVLTGRGLRRHRYEERASQT